MGDTQQGGAGKRGSFAGGDDAQPRGSFTAFGSKLPGDERDATIERILKATDPNITSTPVYFDYKKDARTYRYVPNTDHTAFHLSLDGCCVRNDSSEAAQLHEDLDRRQREFEMALEAERNPDLVDEGVSTTILRNQFNFRERGSQTMNPICVEKIVMTDPPPSVVLAGISTAWDIYDSYEADRLANERAGTTKKAAAGGGGAAAASSGAGSGGGAGDDRGSHVDPSSISGGGDGRGAASAALQTSSSFLNALRTMERMINQNDSYDVIDDFKYWEDQSDRYRDEGSLLPLWKFFSARARKKQSVTGIAVNPLFTDMFAVGFGTYDFQRQSKGYIECYTLKNAVPSTPGDSLPSTPEYSIAFDSGVVSLAFHPTQCSLLACGLYDGSIHVYDLSRTAEPERSDASGQQQQKRIRPLYVSTIKNGKHTEPVWGLQWITRASQNSNASSSSSQGAANLQLLSISSDSRVVCWTFSRRDMISRDLMKLDATAGGAENGDGKASAFDPETAVATLSGGMCFDILDGASGRMVLGTTEGSVHVCDSSLSGIISESYVGHHMAVYAARWCPFNSDIFLTCSADWTVRLWMHGTSTPLLTFDLGDAVGDVAWAPYSSSVFAAVTASGKVLVFDLNVSKTEALTAQMVVRNAKLTHIVFSPKEPIVLAGDSRGSVLTLKLSPNLRRTCKPQRGEPSDAQAIIALEREKLQRILDVILKDRELLK